MKVHGVALGMVDSASVRMPASGATGFMTEQTIPFDGSRVMR
ncbi:hypothetical protein [Nisaea sediminum]|nr:hypothetical protein [Nisaea sediminum]